MPSYYDESAKTWYYQFYYQDWTGERKKKKKRGFSKKKDSQDWERNFLQQQQNGEKITFENFTAIYFDDMRSRLRQSSIANKEWTCSNKINPYFKNKLIGDITAADVRKWQNELLQSGNADTYNRMINTQFSAIMNYAVKYYGLEKNPVRIAGTIGKSDAPTMDFYTQAEFNFFINKIGNKEPARTGFMTLYFTGMRIGELLALTPSDIDTQNNMITVNKSYRKVGKEDIISPPKTPKSNRSIAIPPFLTSMIQEYESKLHGLDSEDRLFSYSRHYFTHEIARVSKEAGIRRIRVHDFRHSHASLLIEMGFSPLLISERLGHEKVDTTLNIYSHLYPNKQAEISIRLQNLEPK